jgi:5-aminolevulinate synthase
LTRPASRIWIIRATCDPGLCKQISDVLIDRYGIYVRPINYPTLPRSTERLRITQSPHHTDTDIEHLVQSLAEIWAEVGLANAA